MQIKPHHPEDLEQLRQRSRQQRAAKQRDRYRAVVLALEGHSAPQIARTLARSRRCVQIWVYAYRDRGSGGDRSQTPARLPQQVAGGETTLFPRTSSGRSHRPR